MPELPEVEVVTRSLKKAIKNRKIIKITVNNRNLRFKLPKNFESILKINEYNLQGPKLL